MGFGSSEGWLSRLKKGLDRTRVNIVGLFSGGVVDEDFLEELEFALITADIGVDTSSRILQRLRDEIKLKGLRTQEEVRRALRDQIEAILATGIERIYIMPFSRRMAALSASEFVEDILVDGLDTRWLMVGEDFRFGSDRTGDVESLHAFGAEHHFEVFASPLVFHGTSKVSSTRIREELAKGDLYEAYLMLGRRYTMAGRVIHGAALGRTLGYPTLNLAPIPPGSRARPAVTGVFAVRVEGLGPSIRPAVASIGIKPTVTNERRWLLETHVFDWSGSAYGKYVRVHFVEKLRDEKKFGSIEELRAAIESDALRARRILGCTPGDGIFKP